MTATVTNVASPGGFSGGFSSGFQISGGAGFMPLPINCVLIGHQEPISKLMELNKIGGPLKGIFGE